MKHLLIFTLFLLMQISAKGTTFSVMTGNIDSVYYSGTVAGETKYQNQAIAFLCNEYLKKYYPTIKEKVFLELGFGDKYNSKLSYDKFQGQSWENAEQNRPVQGFGIRIRLSQNLNRAESVLKLLDYGLNNLQKLKDVSNNFYKMDYYDRPQYLTVDSVTLSNVLKEPVTEKIKSTIAIKVFRNLGKEEYEVNREYFFQNDKYHFIDFRNKDSVYLKLKQVYQIIDEYYLGSIIFDTDSTGYFYSRESKQLSSKFKITGKKKAFYYNHTSSDINKKRIYFEYTDFGYVTKKFIYLTNRLILIQKVDEFEDEMINKLTKKYTNR